MVRLAWPFLKISLEDFPGLKRYYLVRRAETLNDFTDLKNAGHKLHLVQLEYGSNIVGWLPGSSGVW